MNEQGQTTRQANLGDAEMAFRIDDAEVIKRGQITIEKKYRNAHDLDIGDYVDIEVYHDDDTIRVPDLRIGESGRVTIPARQRDRYDIREGDRVNVGVYID